jgi:hypothetical protein
MAQQLVIEFEGHPVLIDGKFQTIPFTKVDVDYLTGYVHRNAAKELAAFKDSHICSKCADMKSTKAMIHHKEEVFWRRCREGKVFRV